MADHFQTGATCGDYRIQRLLGKGGMAEVYAVENVRTGAPYALKVFVCGTANAANAIFLKKRFLSEGRLMAKLNHPRIVRVYDFGYADGVAEQVPYFVMDLVESALGGEKGAPPRPLTLRDALAAGLSTEERIAGWYGDLVEALDYIHARNVVHRDVSLENVLVGPDGRAVLSDFGVARILDRDLRAELNLTLVTLVKTGAGTPVLGKSFYLAPEIRKGEPATAAADWYALGVMLYFLLVQNWYVPGGKLEGSLAFADEQWQRILPALLAEDPARRTCLPWQDPRDGELEHLRAREQTQIRSRGMLVGRLRRRSRVWAGVAAGAFLLAVGVALWRPRLPPPPAGEPEIDIEKKASACCALPESRRGKHDDEGKSGLAAAYLARDSIVAVMRSARRIPALNVPHVLDELADKFTLDAIDAETLRQTLRLFYLQAAFHLYLDRRDFIDAASALKRIGDDDPDWADDLYKSRGRLGLAPADLKAFEDAYARLVE